MPEDLGPKIEQGTEKGFNLERAAVKLREKWESMSTNARKLARGVVVAAVLVPAAVVGVSAVIEQVNYADFDKQGYYEILPGEVAVRVSPLGGFDGDQRCVYDLTKQVHVLKDIQGKCNLGNRISLFNRGSTPLEIEENMEKIGGPEYAGQTRKTIVAPGDSDIFAQPFAITGIHPLRSGK